jgi:dCMP deaminase
LVEHLPSKQNVVGSNPIVRSNRYTFMKPKLIPAHMRTAYNYAELSSARRLKVGAIIVKDNRIISIGYNGMPEGWDNNCEHETIELYSGHEGAIHRAVLKTRPEVLHAEMNAIGKLARSTEGGEGATMFITHSPCTECAKLIHVSGINRVFYSEDYRSRDGITFLEQCGIPVSKVEL